MFFVLNVWQAADGAAGSGDERDAGAGSAGAAAAGAAGGDSMDDDNDDDDNNKSSSAMYVQSRQHAACSYCVASRWSQSRAEAIRAWRRVYCAKSMGVFSESDPHTTLSKACEPCRRRLPPHDCRDAV